MLTIFTFLWAAAILTHQVWQGAFARPGWDAIASLAALWALLRPSSMPRLVVMLTAQVFVFWLQMPDVVNHWLLACVLAMAMLHCIALRAARGGALDRTALFAQVGILTRGGIIIVYVFAALAKFNTAYFDPGLSCAPWFYYRLVRKFPFLPASESAGDFSIYCSIVLECALPLLLLFRRTRLAGILLGWLFHLLMSIMPHFDFAMFAMAGYVAFLPDDFPARIERLRDAPSRISDWGNRVAECARHRAAFPILAVLCMGVLLLPATGQISREDLAKAEFHILQYTVLLLEVGLLAVFVAAMRPGGERMAGAATRLRLAHASLMIWPLLLVLNGLCPYLGLKTDSSFSMFSNLQTEDEQWNHCFMPRRMKVFGFQDDLVTFSASSNRQLQANADAGTRLVYMSFQDFARRHPDDSVTFQRGGEQRIVPRMGSDPLLATRAHPILVKLFLFRDVPRADRNARTH